jgi:hypothetical protein
LRVGAHNYGINAADWIASGGVRAHVDEIGHG